MQLNTKKLTLAMGIALFVSSITLLAQQHDHSQHQMPMPGGQAQAASSTNDEVAIFCPTMKTGQLCSHGTANILQCQGDKAEQWMTLSRKYNKAVDTATLELFKDAEGVLTPEQLKQLKAWFAVGLNPQINDLLYSKGLGPKDMPVAAKK